MRRSMRVSVAAIAAVLAAAAVSAPAEAAPTVKTYANCAAIHKVYSGGIAKSGVTVDRTASGSRPLRGTVKTSTPLYNANKKSDRDHDGVACEKS